MKQCFQKVRAAVIGKLVFDVPFALFGLLFGAFLVLVVAHNLLVFETQRPLPLHLSVSDSLGPQISASETDR